ncbi:MAG: UDP-2,3-diacylglucosamine diphosphatase [Bacteriovoracia bacterium]
MSKLIVLSDLHLWGSADPLYRALLQFIDENIHSGDKFFVVGDLFDLFVGPKTIFVERYSELITKIQQRTDVEFFYIEGNHDFHLESIFENSPHVKIYADSLYYEWNGKKFLFAHGDKINKRDIPYQMLRLFTRNLFSQCIIEAAPGKLINFLGKSFSKASRDYHPGPNSEIVTLFRNYACEQLAHGLDVVVLGHSHYFDDIRFRIEGREGQYVNAGFPRMTRKYFEMSEADPFFVTKNWEGLLSLTKS